MDIASHGLWGGVAFGRKSRKSFWLAFCFGIAPDFFSFGIFFIHRWLTNGFSLGFHGKPDIAIIPSYVPFMYNITHSLVIFVVVFFIVWFFMKRPVYEMCAWPFHIIMDIFTHSAEYFPTPFLFPLSNYHFHGISWGNPMIFFPNLALLAIAYIWFYRFKKKTRIQ